MTYGIIALIVLCVIIIVWCISILVYVPPVKIEKINSDAKKQEQKVSLTFGTSVSYWQNIMNFILESNKDISSLTGVAFKEGLLLYDIQNKGNRESLVFYFHTQKALTDFLQAYTKCFKEALPIQYDIYCAFSYHYENSESDILSYLKQKNISFDICVEQADGWDTLFSSEPYMCIGVLRPAKYELQVEDVKDIKESIYSNDLVKINYQKFKKDIPTRLRLQYKFLKKGMKHLVCLEPKLINYMASKVDVKGNEVTFRFSDSLQIEEFIQDYVLTHASSHPILLSQEIESKNYKDSDIVKKIDRIIHQVTNLETLYVYKTQELLAEKLFKTCITFDPCTSIEVLPHYKQIEIFTKLCLKDE